MTCGDSCAMLVAGAVVDVEHVERRVGAAGEQGLHLAPRGGADRAGHAVLEDERHPGGQRGLEVGGSGEGLHRALLRRTG
jgi:hypothetical protein